MDLGKLHDIFSVKVNEKHDEMMKTFTQTLRKATDKQVLYKLETTSGEAYEIAENEARRRGLI